MAASAPAPAPVLHLADVYEAIADNIPGERALAWRGQTRTWGQLEDRAARLASAFQAAGLGHGSVVALFLHNSPAYIEGQFAALKIRATPINANYRYQAEELEYLLDNCDAEAVVFDEDLADRVAAVAGRLPKLKLLVEAGSGGTAPGSRTLESIIASHEPAARMERSPDDLHMTYTGGTTGMPKGVRNKVGKMAGGVMAIAAGGLGVPVPQTAAEAGTQAARIAAEGRLPVSVVIPPFMHATGMVYGAMAPMMAGGSCVMLDSWSFDADEALAAVQRERATSLTIVGDVVARPIADALQAAAARGNPYDISSLRAVYSAGMIWTAPTKRVILEHAPDATLIDVVGSSEGHVGTSFATRGNIPDTGVFTPNATTKVLREDGTEIAPGSGERGLLACAGPITGSGYHKDPEKSAKTYKVIGGVNYVIAGDWATIEADGSIRFLGRDSSCINTGGEKVFAEEVEQLILRMPGVADAIVVGVPDERWGQAVSAVIKAQPGAAIHPGAVQDWVKTELAGYKAPRHIVITDDFPRSPNGKSDIPGARQMVVAALDPATPVAVG